MDDGSSQAHSSRSLLFGDISGEVIGAFYAVYNALGFGFLESAYSGALALELAARGLQFRREQPLQVRYNNQVVGVYRADFVVEQVLMLELKSMAAVGHPEKRQLLHYLCATDMRVGLLFNFGPEPGFLRVVNTPRG